jgi:hypothetical protein
MSHRDRVSTPSAGGVALTPAPRRRRIPAVTMIAGLALLAGACGADEEAARGTAAAAHGGGPAAVAADDGRAVADYFRRVTGFKLNVEATGLFDSLSPDRSDPGRSMRLTETYGSFNFYVFHEPGSEHVYREHDGRRIKPDRNGVYWHEMGGSWSAMKPYGTVVLDWIVDERRVDDRFHRLDVVLSRLGEPADSVLGTLPAEHRPCKGRASTGTCRDATGRTITAVGGSEWLDLPGLRARVARVDTGRTVVPPKAYGHVSRAKGVFVLATVRLENRGTVPLRSLSGVKLEVGGRRYEQDFGAGYTVTAPNAFPLQPGEKGVAGVVFDVPPAVAREAASAGVLAFPGDEELRSVDYAARIGLIRLGGASTTASGQGQAS